MFQFIDNLQGVYRANIEGRRGVILQFEDQSSDDLKHSPPDRGLVEDGRVFVPQYEILTVIAALAKELESLLETPGKDVLGQAKDCLENPDED